MAAHGAVLAAAATASPAARREGRPRGAAAVEDAPGQRRLGKCHCGGSAARGLLGEENRSPVWKLLIDKNSWGRIQDFLA